MLRFIHSSDWHLTAGKLFDETLRCLEVVMRPPEPVDGFLLPGDFAHADLPHRVQSPLVRNELARLFASGEHHLVHGNHDIEGDLALFGCLPGVNVYPLADLVHRPGFDVLSVPYPHKRHWLARRDTGAAESQRQEVSATLGAALRALAKLRRPDVPLIGLAHLNIAGSRLGGGEVLIGQEIELSPADLDEIGCDYWALGHIHEPQQVADRAWYCGTPQPHSFGDSNVNGFNLVEIEGPGKSPRVTFIETPAVKLCTLRATWFDDDVAGWVIQYTDEDLGPAGKRNLIGAHVRVVATVDEAARDAAAWDRLEALAPGALSVRVERRIIPTTRVRFEAIRAARTVEEKLAAYWSTLEPAPAVEEQAGAVGALGEIA